MIEHQGEESPKEKKAIKEMVLAFLEKKCHQEAAKATADGDGVSPTASLSLAIKSSATGVTHTGVKDRVDAYVLLVLEHS